MRIDDRDWQAESDMRTLAEAREIQADNKRTAAARDAAAEHMESLRKATGTGETALEKGYTSLGRMGES